MSIRPASDLNNWSTDILEVEIGWTAAAVTVISSGCHLELIPLRHRQPVEDIAKDRVRWSHLPALTTAAALRNICVGDGFVYKTA